MEQEPDFVGGEKEHGPEDAGDEACEDNSTAGNFQGFVVVPRGCERQWAGSLRFDRFKEHRARSGHCD